MPLILLLSVVTADPAAENAARLIARAHTVTAVRVTCPVEAEPGEVVVCGRRRADRYRLPLIGGDGGSGIDPTPARREALLVPANNCAEKSAFLVGCGHAGVGVGIMSDGKTRLLKPRELSP